MRMRTGYDFARLRWVCAGEGVDIENRKLLRLTVFKNGKCNVRLTRDAQAGHRHRPATGLPRRVGLYPVLGAGSRVRMAAAVGAKPDRVGSITLTD